MPPHLSGENFTLSWYKREKYANRIMTVVKQVRENNRQKAETPEADKVSVSENLGE